MKNIDIQRFLRILHEWIPADASIVIAASSSYIYCQSGTVPLPYEVGETIAKNSLATSVLTTKKLIEIECCATEFGITCQAKGFPIPFNEERAALLVFQPIQTKNDPIHFITGKSGELWKPIKVEHIYFIESKDKKTWITTNEGTFHITMTLKELTTMLPSNFIRIHRSIISNLIYIQEITKDFTSALQITLQNGTTLPVSQSYTHVVREKLRF